MEREVQSRSVYLFFEELGRILYTEYVIAFEIAAIILLVAIISAIALTFRGRKHRKAQVISEQLMATKKNRLKIVQMDAEINASEELDTEQDKTEKEGASE